MSHNVALFLLTCWIIIGCIQAFSEIHEHKIPTRWDYWSMYVMLMLLLAMEFFYG